MTQSHPTDFPTDSYSPDKFDEMFPEMTPEQMKEKLWDYARVLAGNFRQLNELGDKLRSALECIEELERVCQIARNVLAQVSNGEVVNKGWATKQMRKMDSMIALAAPFRGKDA